MSWNLCTGFRSFMVVETSGNCASKNREHQRNGSVSGHLEMPPLRTQEGVAAEIQCPLEFRIRGHPGRIYNVVSGGNVCSSNQWFQVAQRLGGYKPMTNATVWPWRKEQDKVANAHEAEANPICPFIFSAEHDSENPNSKNQ